MTRRVLALLGAALILGAAANAVSPRGLSWSDPLGRDPHARVLRAGLKPIDRAEVARLLEDRGVLFLDARGADEYRSGRLPRARSMPWREIEERGAAAPPPGRVVVYCSNEFCDDALELGRWLRSRGHRDVSLYVQGYDEWWNSGGSTEKD